MEKITYVKINPNRNTTILVLDKYPRSKYPALSKLLMRSESIYAEQVGFIEVPADSRACCGLYMMGGEFCANATASLCAYLAYVSEMASEAKMCFRLEVSGTETLIDGEAQKQGKGYRVQISMPLPSGVREDELIYQGKHIVYGIVEYPGICHAIIHDENQDEQSKGLAHYILHQGIQTKYSAKGATLFSKKKRNILPLIYVAETDTEIWENSCGTASAALAVYLAYKRAEDVKISVEQPSGDYVQACVACRNGMIHAVNIEENVFLSSMGIAFI